jgi:hypothetical protein
MFYILWPIPCFIIWIRIRIKKQPWSGLLANTHTNIHNNRSNLHTLPLPLYASYIRVFSASIHYTVIPAAALLTPSFTYAVQKFTACIAKSTSYADFKCLHILLVSVITLSYIIFYYWFQGQNYQKFQNQILT